MLKSYANLELGQTHFRQCGQGQTVILLHASPMSSAFMQPIMRSLSDEFHVIAPDTPGYGQSDPLPQDVLLSSDDLTPYVEWLSQFISALNLDDIVLYGTATGAQLAIEYARHHSQKLQGLIIDNAAHFEPDERDDIMNGYFPSLAPQADGSHFNVAWEMADAVSQWFPWYSQDEEHRISNHPMPADLVHMTAMAYLQAGEDYAQAYRRAFLNENATRVQSLSLPIRVIRWKNSVLKQYCDRYDQFKWASNVKMRFCDGGTEQRFATIKASATELNQVNPSK